MRIISLFISIALLTLMGCSNAAKSPEELANILWENMGKGDPKNFEPIFMSKEDIDAAFKCSGEHSNFLEKQVYDPFKAIVVQMDKTMATVGFKFTHTKTDVKPGSKLKAGDKVAVVCGSLKDAEFAMIESYIKVLGSESKLPLPITQIDGKWYIGGIPPMAMGTRSATGSTGADTSALKDFINTIK